MSETTGGDRDGNGQANPSIPYRDQPHHPIRSRANFASACRTPKDHTALPQSTCGWHRIGFAAHLWRGTVGAEEQPHAESGAGRTLQHRSSQCCRWLDNVAAGLCRDSPRRPPAWATIARGPGRPIVTAEGQSDRLALTPNNNVPTRKPRRRDEQSICARPRRLTPPHAASQETPPRLRHLLMKPSLRTGRIANFSSSMPRLIGGLQRPIGFHVQRPPLSCKQGRSFQQLSLLGFARIYPDKSRRKSPKISMTPQLAAPADPPRGSPDRGL